jgi:hypothetical protein
MVAVPLTAKKRVVGLIEAFSNEAFGFNGSDVRSLNLLGGWSGAIPRRRGSPGGTGQDHCRADPAPQHESQGEASAAPHVPAKILINENSRPRPSKKKAQSQNHRVQALQSSPTPC